MLIHLHCLKIYCYLVMCDGLGWNSSAVNIAVNRNNKIYVVSRKFFIFFGVVNFEFEIGNIHNLLEHFENRLK